MSTVFSIVDGDPALPGATYDARRGGVNFALFSAHATKVELCVFDPGTGQETARLALPKRDADGMWSGFIPGAQPGMIYGYRVHGPYEPAQGHRFNPHKLLLDPYAKEIAGTYRRGPVHLGYEPYGNPYDKTHMSRTDNAADMVKAVVPAPDCYDWGGVRPRTPWAKTVIYEAHVKGFSKLNPGVPHELRGTYAGMASDESIAHLKKLGVTAVELMPAQTFLNEERLEQSGLSNYWGYNTLNFFTPHGAYLSGRQKDEFKTMVRRLHEAGIEVILDVVYNHTAEGDETGPTLSYRGIDNASYYALRPQDKSRYVNDTGCGNTVDASHPQVMRMILDSMRHMVTEYNVDGFRLDLAVTLGRDKAHGFNYRQDAPIFEAIRKDPVLSKVKMSGEPWDIGWGGYHLGRLPRGMYEWTDIYKKGVRDFWLHGKSASNFAARLAGSSDVFNSDGKYPGRGISANTFLRPRVNQGINTLTTHDGFTMLDLLSYNSKQNMANGEGNRDGNDGDICMDNGAHGPTNDAAVNRRRLKQVFNMAATGALSHGPLLVRMGDEMLQTQKGNNNAYCQDNDTSWLAWDNLQKPEAQTVLGFWQYMMDMRKGVAALARNQFPHGSKKDAYGVKDISWWSPSGREQMENEWRAHTLCFGLMYNNAAFRTKQASGVAGLTDKARLLNVFNAAENAVTFQLPVLPGGGDWDCLVNTDKDQPFVRGGSLSAHKSGSVYAVPPKSTVIFVQRPAPL